MVAIPFVFFSFAVPTGLFLGFRFGASDSVDCFLLSSVAECVDVDLSLIWRFYSLLSLLSFLLAFSCLGGTSLDLGLVLRRSTRELCMRGMFFYLTRSFHSPYHQCVPPDYFYSICVLSKSADGAVFLIPFILFPSSTPPFPYHVFSMVLALSFFVSFLTS